MYVCSYHFYSCRKFLGQMSLQEFNISIGPHEVCKSPGLLVLCSVQDAKSFVMGEKFDVAGVHGQRVLEGRVPALGFEWQVEEAGSGLEQLLPVAGRDGIVPHQDISEFFQ